ncbi:winged helix DNA-binding protein [Stakelama sp. CBK3Z-3]|uniref:Winged helix DNA-binding protein n=1 Tax=Stakelama flava TaxID=2860338 RepID=A0ABS6XIS4_9SPHN|nr:winged helix DNA-binding protein [Stakelama flava]MBW4330119.1 winged helix DNA-binding protein [Stakelama flava]
MNLEYGMPGASFEGDEGRRISAAVVAVCGCGAAERRAREAATLAGARISAMLAFTDAEERLARQATLDVILIDAQEVAHGALEPTLDAAVRCAEETGAQIVAVFTPDQIDIIAARLFGHGAHLLCDPSLAEQVSALAVAGRRMPMAFHDAARDSESQRLARLNQEVARIAETLSRLTRNDSGGNNGAVGDRSTAYDAPPLQKPTHEPEVDAARVRDVIRTRRLRDRFFVNGLFADPAWDMLLDLFAAELDANQVSVSSLCIAAAVPPTTALRWITNLTEAGLLRREADPLDRRRVFIALTPKASRAMRDYFAALGPTTPGRA